MKEKVLLKAVVVFLVKDNDVLLAQKINKDKEEIKIAEDMKNGYGGGIELGETPKKAAKREVWEESNHRIILREEDLELRAVVYCHNRKNDGKIFKCKLYVFTVSKFEGTAEDSDEMINATWFPQDNIPFSQMVPTDADWLPRVLKGELLIARVFLGNSQKIKLKKTQIKMVKNLPK